MGACGRDACEADRLPIESAGPGDSGRGDAPVGTHLSANSFGQTQSDHFGNHPVPVDCRLSDAGKPFGIQRIRHDSSSEPGAGTRRVGQRIGNKATGDRFRHRNRFPALIEDPAQYRSDAFFIATPDELGQKPLDLEKRRPGEGSGFLDGAEARFRR